ncbi:MAG: hypothetical protein MPN21_14290 [Thermoanaerobaculia bacterium]|nr:hypothetical protein [Thermoanaerobaculia bacterium]
MTSLDLLASKLRQLRYRTSDRYELVLHDRLRPEERARFQELNHDPSHWGVLRPRGDGTYRAVDRDTALLLFSLSERGPLPAYVVDQLEEGTARAVHAMVLDGILDAETVDGKPVRMLAGDDESALSLDSCSLTALRYGAALDLDDARDLSIRLYLYGGEPLRRDLCDRLATRRDVSRFLELESGGANRRRIGSGWRLDDRPDKGWIYVRRNSTESAASPSSVRGRCKLYVGCRCAETPRVLGAVLTCLSSSSARSMKVGGSAADLVRADKIVVYFDAFESLQSYAAELSELMEDLELSDDPSGVPFTASAGGDGRLSWGADPPEEAIPLKNTFATSWRAWVAARLAGALVATRTPGLADEEWRLRAVLARVGLDGIDVARWAPTTQLWRDAT